jgi:hypothetical protein
MSDVPRGFKEGAPVRNGVVGLAYLTGAAVVITLLRLVAALVVGYYSCF